MKADEIDRVVRNARASATATEILEKYRRQGGTFDITFRITEANLRKFIVGVVNYAFLASNTRELDAIIDGAYKTLMESRTRTPGMNPKDDPL